MNANTRERLDILMRRVLRSRPVQKIVRETIIHIPDTFTPFRPHDQNYGILKGGPEPERCSQGLAVPPQSLQMGYENYLEKGERDVAKMRAALQAAGHQFAAGGRTLEWGCAGGRLLRWLYDVSDQHEIWGCDIDARYMVWCGQHLSPPFNFVTTTSAPHLPFEDRYFDLIFAGSVMTHIDDLAKAWLLELRRVLKPGAMLYITIHDKHSIELFHGEHRERPLAQRLRRNAEASRWARSDFEMFTMGRGAASQVFYDVDYLRRTVEPFFEMLSVEEEAYGRQTALLFQRRSE